MSADKSKPVLTLLHGQRVTLESLAAMFEQMTGRKPTPEELARARAVMPVANDHAPKRD